MIRKEMHLHQYVTGCILLHSDICAKILSRSDCYSHHCSCQFVAVGRRTEFKLVVILLIAESEQICLYFNGMLGPPPVITYYITLAQNLRVAVAVFSKSLRRLLVASSVTDCTR